MRAFLLLAILSTVICLSVSASGATWYVDGSVSSSGDGASWETALKTIREGINKALEGDTVTVAEGVYVESIFFIGNIVLRSTDPFDPDVVASTIIDGNRAWSVVNFDVRQNESCRLSGFTIQNGRASTGGGIHGGQSNGRTHATIENNVICKNVAVGEGGGGIAFCDGAIRSNVINDNRLEEVESGGGAGLYDCDGVIENNTISNNVAWPREPSIWNRTCGGGLYRCDGTVQNNVIVGNRANAGSGGGLDGCEGAIRNNIIAGNVAYGDGGGLNGCGGTIENNAIIVNRAEGGVLEVGCGGGLRSCNGVIRGNIIAGNSALYDGGGMDFCTGLIQNCTITGNSAATRGGGLCGCYGKIENCIIWGNTAPSDAQLYESSIPNFSCIEGSTTGGEGNISLDPKFADADGADNDPDTYEDNDYRLLPSSPCIDAGKNEDGMIGAVDLDGNPRIWRGASSWTVDMGAYEYGSFPFRCVAVVKEVSGKCQITWNSRVGDNYTVQSCTDLGAGNWIDAATIASGGETTAWTDPDVSNEVKFYRVEMK